jgi:hypothetical protein
MSHGPDLPLPTARALQGWWRELAPFHPRRFWFGRLFLHHVDALVETTRAAALDPLQHALLRVVAVNNSLAAGFDPQVRTRLLNELSTCGLIAQAGRGWQVTPAGHAAVSSASYKQAVRCRRPFWFIDNAVCDRPLLFVLPQRPLEATVPPERWAFPANALAACIQQPLEWKERHGFPTDVRAVVDLAAAPGDWRAVMIDRAERFLGLVVATVEGSMTAFSVRPEAWGLEREPPAFTLAAGWQDVLPDLASEPAPEAWRQAWLAWCQQRGVTPADAEFCVLERDGQRLMVRAPKKLGERLRAARGEPLKNEAWLTAGDGRFRTAAQIELTH